MGGCEAPGVSGWLSPIAIIILIVIVIFVIFIIAIVIGFLIIIVVGTGVRGRRVQL